MHIVDGGMQSCTEFALKVSEFNSFEVYTLFLRLRLAFWRYVANAQISSNFRRELSLNA